MPDAPLQDQIQTYRKVVWRWKWYLVVPTVLAVAVTVPVVMSLPPVYQSTTLIMIEPQKVPAEFVKPTITVPVEERLKTISQQVLSRTRLERIIDEFKLYQDESGPESPQWLSAVFSWFGVRPRELDDAKPLKLDLVERMRKNTTIGVTGGNSFSISYSGADPVQVRDVTNKLASLFIEENLKVREEQAEGTAEFLESELERVKTKLEEQENEVRAFKQRYMGELPGQLDANLRTLDRLQNEKNSLDEQMRSAQERYDALRQLELLEVDPLSGKGAPTGPLEMRLQTLKNRYNELLRKYKDDYPDVVSVKKEITQLEAEAEAKRSSDQAGNQHEETDQTEALSPRDEMAPVIAGIKDRRNEVVKQIRLYQERVDNTFLREQQLTMILRDYENINKGYQGLLEKRQNARIAESLERRQKGEIFRVLDPADLPERPYKPNRLKLIAIGCLFGLGLGMGLAFLREQLDGSIQDESELIRTTRLPVLGVIPFIAAKPVKRDRGPRPIVPLSRKSRASL